ncbi:MAG: sugar ABC transporter permease [Phycisphaerae bacterium]|nr:sugar ABC transporter permease [Phycisphaerae bacterium]
MPRHSSTAYAFLSVPLLVLWIFTLMPTFGGVLLAFMSWSGSGAPIFIGVDNFLALASDSRFRPAFINTLVFAAITIPVSNGFAFLLAAAVNAPWFRAGAVARLLLFLPAITSLVAIGFAWRWVLDPSGGVVSLALRTVGLPAPAFLEGGTLVRIGSVDLLNWPLLTLAAVQIWRTVGLGVLLYAAAMRGINTSMMEAAESDGASRWRILLTMTRPAVRPTTLFLLFTGLVGSLQAFDLSWALAGGTDSAAIDVLNWFTYRQFQQNRLGYAAASGVVVLLLSALAAGIHWAIAGERES